MMVFLNPLLGQIGCFGEGSFDISMVIDGYFGNKLRICLDTVFKSD